MKAYSIFAAFMAVFILVGCNSQPVSNPAAVQPTTALNTNKADDPTLLHPDVVNWPVLHPNVPANPAEIEAVKDAIKRADKIQMDAEWNGFDYHLFPTVYVDDPAVPPSDRQRHFVQQVIEAQGDKVKTQLKGDGWLTVMIAGQLNLKKGDENWARVLAKAKAAGRDGSQLTPEEQRSIDEGVINGAGSPPDPQATRPPYTTPPYDFKQITIDGNQADVVFDDGIVLAHTFLVKTTEGWKIAGTIVLQSHF